MAKRRKKAAKKALKGGPRNAGVDRGGSRDGDPRPAEDPSAEAGDPSAEAGDPLALEPWPRRAASEEETAERERFENAWRAFQRGDFRSCGAEARSLAGDATSAAVRRRSLALLNRLEVDPLALGMAAVALALLLTAVIWTFA